VQKSFWSTLAQHDPNLDLALLIHRPAVAASPRAHGDRALMLEQYPCQIMDALGAR
jgi:hypothetical protein